ncbi:MAG: hypothetical protein KIS77_22225 [Saprospiraceae bacterium]|nr:hypothetical protein [Saprospiraceae bacterium]
MNRKTEVVIIGALLVASGVYVLLRAWLLPITVDESATAINHVPRLAFDTLFYEKEANPNNHILNTLSIKALTGLLGWHPVVVRMPALLGGCLYAGAAVMLSQKISSYAWVRLFALIMLLGNPYLLEFFSLARGYGLAAGLLLMAVWQAWRFVEANQRRHLTGAMAFAGLAVYANFTVLLFFAPFVTLLLLSAWQSNPTWPLWREKSGTALGLLGVFVALWALPLHRLSNDSEIRHWERIGSFFGSLRLSVQSATHGNAYLGKDTVPTLTWALLLFAVGCSLVSLWRWNQHGRRFHAAPHLFVAALWPGSALTNVLEANLTATPYLQSRLALFYWPLLALLLGVAAAWLWARRGQWVWAMLAPLLLLTAVNMIRCVNLKKTTDWWFDEGTYRVFDYLKKNHEGEMRSEPYSLDAHHVMLNSFIFYLEHDSRGLKRYVKLVPWHGLQPPSKDCDFYFAISEEEAKPLFETHDVVLRLRDNTPLLLRKRLRQNRGAARHPNS